MVMCLNVFERDEAIHLVIETDDDSPGWIYLLDITKIGLSFLTLSYIFQHFILLLTHELIPHG